MQLDQHLVHPAAVHHLGAHFNKDNSWQTPERRLAVMQMPLRKCSLRAVALRYSTGVI